MPNDEQPHIDQAKQDTSAQQISIEKPADPAPEANAEEQKETPAVEGSDAPDSGECESCQ